MVRLDELKSLQFDIGTTYADKGTQVPKNFRRYIFYIKITDLAGTTGQVNLRMRDPTGAVATTTLDKFRITTPYETQEWPSGGAKEDSLPLYILEGSTYLQASAYGTVSALILYADRP